MSKQEPKTKKAKQAEEPTIKGKAGRPRIQFDLKRVYDMGYFRATHETMASLLECSADTIERQLRDPESEFAVAYKKGQSELRSKLSEAQIRVALEGNVTMLIWLGKQYLGQRDNAVEVNPSTPEAVAFAFEEIKS